MRETIFVDWSVQVDTVAELLEPYTGTVKGLTLSPGLYINNVAGFIASHLATCRAQANKATYDPYLQRLWHLADRLETLNIEP